MQVSGFGARDTVGAALGVVAWFAIAFWQAVLPAEQLEVGDALGGGALLQADENKRSGLFGRDIIPDPLGAVGYDTRGNAYLEKGDLDKAVADFTEAIRLIGIACHRPLQLSIVTAESRIVEKVISTGRSSTTPKRSDSTRATTMRSLIGRLTTQGKAMVDLAIEDNSAAISY